MSKPKELADKAVKEFEERFEDNKEAEPFSQAGRFKKLLEELGVEIFCNDDDGVSSILICGTDLRFIFLHGEFDSFEK
jgi:hypothetical protein